MKRKPEPPDSAEPVPEYDFHGGVRGKYAERNAEQTNVVVLDPDVAQAFPTASEVNRALRKLLSTGRQA